MENTSKMDDFGVAVFLETFISQLIEENPKEATKFHVLFFGCPKKSWERLPFSGRNLARFFLKSTILILEVILPGHQMIGQSPIRHWHAAVASARGMGFATSHITRLVVWFSLFPFIILYYCTCLHRNY